MKSKTQPKELRSGIDIEQALFDGLNKNQKTWAKDQIRKFENTGLAIPYGIIRKEALKK